MAELNVRRLNEDELAQAYPLVRSAAGVSSERWDAFARELIASGGGVLGVMGGDACLHGVLAFRKLAGLRHDLSLQVEIFAAFELSPRAPVRRALCDALEEVARAERCDDIIFARTARNHVDHATIPVAGWRPRAGNRPPLSRI